MQHPTTTVDEVDTTDESAIKFQHLDTVMSLENARKDISSSNRTVDDIQNGAWTLYQSLTRRLNQAKVDDDDEETIEEIRDVQQSALLLYLRFNRGDDVSDGIEELKN